MNTIEISNELIQFIESSPSMFHSIKTIRTYLEEDGFTYLPESCAWAVKEGGKYYTIRNHSSLIAFKVGNDMDSYHFQRSVYQTTYCLCRLDIHLQFQLRHILLQSLRC